MVVVIADGAVLLCLNNRDEWELPGGWPEPGDHSLADTVARELREETGLTVVHADIDLIDAELFSPVAGTLVALVCYRVTVSPGSIAELRGSDEHVELRFFSADALPPHLPAVYRRFINAAVR